MSNSTNFIYIKRANKLYMKIQDMLDEEDLSMHVMGDYSKISYQLEKIIKENKYIEFAEECKQDDLLENIMLKLTEENKDNKMQGNTLKIYGTENYMYEVMYLENLIDKELPEEDLNEIASILNIDMEPIYFDICIVKTCYEKGINYNGVMGIKDLNDIILYNFYHIGLIVGVNGELEEIIFPGDKPEVVIGNKFERTNIIDMMGLSVLPYVEKDNNEINKTISNIFREERKGRVLLTLLCPQTNKKFWNFTKETFKSMMEIINKPDSDEIIEKIYKEFESNNKMNNPFFLIKKYCI